MNQDMTFGVGPQCDYLVYKGSYQTTGNILYLYLGAGYMTAYSL